MSHFKAEHVIQKEQPHLFYFLRYYYEFIHGDDPGKTRSSQPFRYSDIEPMVKAALGEELYDKRTPIDESKGRNTALFMFWWFVALTIVVFGVLLPNIIYRQALGTYDLVLSSHGENLWSDGVRTAPVVLISVVMLTILTLAPLTYFAIKGFQKEKELDEIPQEMMPLTAAPSLSRKPRLADVAQAYTHSWSYTIFWFCTSFVEAWMFWLAGGVCGICDLFVLLLGSVSVLGSFFTISRLTHADRPLYQAIAVVISSPVPAIILSAAGSFESETSGADLAGAYIYAIQYICAVGALLYLSNVDQYAFYLHDQVYTISSHVFHSKLRSFFLRLMDGKETDDPDGAVEVARRRNIESVRGLRETSAVRAYHLLSKDSSDDEHEVTVMRMTARTTMRLWIPHVDEHLPSRKKVVWWIRMWGTAFLIVTLVVGIMAIPGLSLSAVLDMRITHSNCEVFQSSWYWPGGRVLFPVSVGIVALVLWIGSFFDRFIDPIYSQIRFQVPIAWRQLLTGVIYACLSLIVAAAVGITDVYLISMLGMCNLVAGFVMQRLKPIKDGWMVAVGYCCALLPWLTCVVYAHLTYASPSRVVLVYVNLGCALVWILFHLMVQMQWCMGWRVYRALEFLSTLLVFLQTVVIITITWSHDLLRY